MQDPLLDTLLDFGLAGLIGFILGLERDMAGSENPHAGTRDFILVALIGAVSGYLSQIYDNSWLIFAGFIGVLLLLISGYWVNKERDAGITSEVAVILSFFLSVLVMVGATEVAIALAIVALFILSQKKAIADITGKLQTYELQAGIKFLVITFIILPVLPNQPLSGYLSVPFGTIATYHDTDHSVLVHLEKNVSVTAGKHIALYDDRGAKVGNMEVSAVTGIEARGVVRAEDGVDFQQLQNLSMGIDLPWLDTMLGALNPYKIWLLVVLVSMISLVGYVTIKVLGPGAGIGLTGLIGGLASSTVTTVSFAKRSSETPALNRGFAVAILLASSIMFFRLLLEIAFVNQELMKNMVVPMTIIGGTGFIAALFFSFISKRQNSIASGEVQLDNPFCLKSAITFAIVFSGILIITRLGTVYLGDKWLPLVAVVSGLVDADAIAFSLSDAQRAGIISLDWASFNLVLGALSNTVVKLFFVFSLGHRQLFKQLTLSFVFISIVGIVTTLLYYDI